MHPTHTPQTNPFRFRLLLLHPSAAQVAFQLYEDAPQELRSRLWMAVLEHPELCGEYQARAGWAGTAGRYRSC